MIWETKFVRIGDRNEKKKKRALKLSCKLEIREKSSE